MGDVKKNRHRFYVLNRNKTVKSREVKGWTLELFNSTALEKELQN